MQTARMPTNSNAASKRQPADLTASGARARAEVRRMSLAVFAILLLSPRAADAAEPVAVASQIRFEVGSAVLTTGSARALPVVATQVQTAFASGRFARLRVEGHTDAQGDAGTNLQLSQARAEAVREALIQAGVPADRLDAVGLGEMHPIASEAEPDGRARNRRVELLLLAKDEKDPVVAVLAQTLNQVQTRPPLQDEWKKAVPKDPLFEAWRVGARARSAADVTFTKDDASLHVRENTVVVIFGTDSSAASSGPLQSVGRVSLESGALKSRLASLRGERRVEINTVSAVTDVVAADVLVNLDAAGTSRVANHKGKGASVRSTRDGAKRAVLVEEGFGSAVARGADPSPPVRLPVAPPVTLGGASAQTHTVEAGPDGTGALLVEWQPRADIASCHVELSRLAADGTVDALVEVEDIAPPVNRFAAEHLPPGAYLITVSAVDAAGFEGPPSAATAVAVKPHNAAPPTPATPASPPLPPPPPAGASRLPARSVLPETPAHVAPVPPQHTHAALREPGLPRCWAAVPLGAAALAAAGIVASEAVPGVLSPAGAQQTVVIPLAGTIIVGTLLGAAIAMQPDAPPERAAPSAP